MAAEFTCEICKGHFEQGWSEEEALSEAETEFPGLKPEGLMLVCDDCYRDVRAQLAAFN